MCHVHVLVFLHNKDILSYFSSLLADSVHFQLTSTISTTVLLVELMMIKHGITKFHVGIGNFEGDVFLIPVKASNITGIENLLISYRF